MITLQALATLLVFFGNLLVAWVSWRRYKNELRLFDLEKRRLELEQEKTLTSSKI
jgi:hypothetical protein